MVRQIPAACVSLRDSLLASVSRCRVRYRTGQFDFREPTEFPGLGSALLGEWRNGREMVGTAAAMVGWLDLVCHLRNSDARLDCDVRRP